jgi:basic membrane protein A
MPLALVAAAAALAAGVAAAQRDAISTVRMAVVTDIGGLNDRSFNFLANRGRLRAQRELRGLRTRVYVTNTASERLPNLLAAARQGNRLIFATGFLMFDSVGKAARAFPNVQFAGIDIPVEAVPENSGANLRNVRGIVFKEQEAGYLVGYIAGLVLRQTPGEDIASAVGANQVPAIVRFIAGYYAGVHRAFPRATVFHNYAQDPTFNDQAKCKETALNQIQRGSRIIFQVAGGCGLGALTAARENNRWGIGVDADQYYLGPHMLTSATKTVDVAVFLTTRAYRRNPARFRGGFDVTFTVKNGGVGYGRVSRRIRNRAEIIRKVERIKRQIARGRIRPPTTIPG